ncbi:terpene synthase family protein [Amycolatopsis acidiphila]|uniref:Terpene synthase n=1 Tax=Amycolatopsis acidiphila TaxID=715473 RepID=A0A558ACP4_9PSEU|nr:terpene synthase family protein [Amycolatopsis acidiphila]TVT22031.1 hypothetical protein FNH06_14825 [Amycolatopsis acidiphila]UIJ63651.1 terpene synthase family protein [Amycolatopsis acidiphila]GHG67679.1 hypothetical protein GCM10017788_26760 [Amycolatopsis acidiphila]
MTTLELRPFYCPIDSAIHDSVDEVEQEAVRWIDRLRFYRDETGRARILATNSAEFYARFAPDACRDGLQAAVHWVYWGFAFDDARCDHGKFSADPQRFLAMAGPLQRALENPWQAPPGNDPFVAALQDIGRRFHACATPVQVRRFTEAHRAWLFGVAWQVANCAAGRMPTLADYTAMRLNGAGGPPTLAMLEIAMGEEVPAPEMDSPAVRALTEMAMLVASWDNDLHSYRRETDERHTDQNLINVLRVHEGLPPARALAEAYGLRDRVMARFLSLREDVLAAPHSHALGTYLRCLGHAIRGNTDWALRVPRYTAYGDVPAPRGPSWADEPSDPRRDPLPIPAIAWWWDPQRTRHEEST